MRKMLVQFNKLAEREKNLTAKVEMLTGELEAVKAKLKQGERLS